MTQELPSRSRHLLSMKCSNKEIEVSIDEKMSDYSILANLRNPYIEDIVAMTADIRKEFRISEKKVWEE